MAAGTGALFASRRPRMVKNLKCIEKAWFPVPVWSKNSNGLKWRDLGFCTDSRFEWASPIQKQRLQSRFHEVIDHRRVQDALGAPARPCHRNQKLYPPAFTSLQGWPSWPIPRYSKSCKWRQSHDLVNLSYGSGPGGRWFKSTRPDHFYCPLRIGLN